MGLNKKNNENGFDGFVVLYNTWVGNEQIESCFFENFFYYEIIWCLYHSVLYKPVAVLKIKKK